MSPLSLPDLQQLNWNEWRTFVRERWNHIFALPFPDASFFVNGSGVSSRALKVCSAPVNVRCWTESDPDQFRWILLARVFVSPRHRRHVGWWNTRISPTGRSVPCGGGGCQAVVSQAGEERWNMVPNRIVLYSKQQEEISSCKKNSC